MVGTKGWVAMVGVLAALSMGCAERRHPADPTPRLNDPYLSLDTEFGSGHGCPIGKFSIMTAAHVLRDYHTGERAEGATWQNEIGQTGLAHLAGKSCAQDTALLMTDFPLTRWYEVGELTEDVFWWEYELRRPADMFRRKLRVGKVLRTYAGNVVIDALPEPGASGSCLLNDRGEAVGIVIRGYPIQKIGVAARIFLQE